MSQNPATLHRRALAPPAVTRFQLHTASASEAVFAPPFVAPRGQYTAPCSIHAPEHDSWPVAAPAGAAVPAWSEGPEATSPEPYLERMDTPRDPAFPLDAFIVPASVAQPPAGYADSQAGQLADRLEELARQIRERGIGAIGSGNHPAQLARVLGAIMAGYLARDS